MTFARRIVAELAQLPPATVDRVLARLTVTDLAALQHDWLGTWARPEQVPPDGNWRSWGWCAGLGNGKTRSIAEYFLGEIEAGRIMRLGLIAQNETMTKQLLVDGKSGLITLSPPWFRARWEKGVVVWPNGALAHCYTPEVPGAIRGPEHDAGWASEIAFWPTQTRDEAFSNFRRRIRLGRARLLWDTTPKRRHPIVGYLLRRAAANPARHIVMRGQTADNIENLNPEEVREWYAELAGTQRGREELLGEYLDDDEGALWKQAWIDMHRRELPSSLARRILIVDPAISDRKGTDDTGIVDEAQDADGHVYVVADLTGKHPWEAWGELVVERYLAHRCDLIVLERNRGGDACAANIRAAARTRVERLRARGIEARDLRVESIDPKGPRKPHDPGVIYVLEVIGRGSKGARAAPVAGEYEGGRVHHVLGADLTALEDSLTTWEPDSKGESPNALDAMVHGVWELARLDERGADLRSGFVGLKQAAAMLSGPPAQRVGEIVHGRAASSIMAALSGQGWGERL